jgi:stress responsive alpha/beta barrel protein
MISHVVLMRPRPDLSARERALFVDAFERAVNRIPTVRHVRIGTRVTIGASYEEAAPDTGAFIAVIDFDSVAGLQAYLSHPEHESLGRLFYQTLQSAWVYDYDVGGIEKLKDVPLSG